MEQAIKDPILNRGFSPNKNDEPINGLTRKGILEAIRENGKRGISVPELKWFTGADIFVILKALKQLQKANLISVRKRHSVHWCYLLHEVA